jgi:hypothetical protein
VRLKIVQPQMAGYSAQIWIDGELSTDVVELNLHINPTSFSTCTMTRILTDTEFDGQLDGFDEEAQT